MRPCYDEGVAKHEFAPFLETVKQTEIQGADPVLNFWRETLNVQSIDESATLLDPETIAQQRAFRAEYSSLVSKLDSISKSGSDQLDQLKSVHVHFQNSELDFQQTEQAREIVRRWRNSDALIALDLAVGNCSKALPPADADPVDDAFLQTRVQELTLLGATQEEQVAFFQNQLSLSKKRNLPQRMLETFRNLSPQVRREKTHQLRSELSALHAKLSQDVVALARRALADCQQDAEASWDGLDAQTKSQQIQIFSAAMNLLVESIQRQVVSVVPAEVSAEAHLSDSAQCRDEWKMNFINEITQEIATLENETHVAEEQVINELRTSVSEQSFISNETLTAIKQSGAILQDDLARELIATAATKIRHRFHLSQPEQLLRDIDVKLELLRKTDEGGKLADEISASKNMVVAELFSSQTLAWLRGYKDVWQQYFSGATDSQSIDFDTSNAQLAFAQSGCEIGFGSFNVVDCLKRTADSHNKIIGFLADWRAVRNQGEDEGAELFTALVSAPEQGVIVKPYGAVRIDTTPPVSSIRLICSDTRDYKLAVGDVGIKGHEEASETAQKSSSAGMSFQPEKAFAIAGIGMVRLPFTAHLEESNLQRMEIIRTHEDAHQAIGFRPYSETDPITSGIKRVNRKHINHVIDRALTAEGKKTGLTALRPELRDSLHDSLIHARDEVQAYLADGSDLPRIYNILSTNDLYDYVAPEKYRIEQMRAINAAPNKTDEERQVEIEEFKTEVLFARRMYQKILEQFLHTVQRLKMVIDTEFANHDDALQALVVLERNMLPEEQTLMARYLRMGSAQKEKMPQLHAHESQTDVSEMSVEQAKRFTASHPEAATSLITIARAFAEHTPAYYSERLPALHTIIDQLTQNSLDMISPELLYAAREYFIKATQMSDEIIWTEEERRQKEENDTWKSGYRDSGNVYEEYFAAMNTLDEFLQTTTV